MMNRIARSTPKRIFQLKCQQSKIKRAWTAPVVSKMGCLNLMSDKREHIRVQKENIKILQLYYLISKILFLKVYFVAHKVYICGTWVQFINICTCICSACSTFFPTGLHSRSLQTRDLANRTSSKIQVGMLQKNKCGCNIGKG